MKRKTLLYVATINKSYFTFLGWRTLADAFGKIVGAIVDRGAADPTYTTETS